jgi:RimJ/RimL family protein N-acetyltransferase
MTMISETERLFLRELTEADAPFIQQLVNTPAWLRFIGDRQVHSTADAVRYLQNGPLHSYLENGFGLWLVALKTNQVPVGICGLIRRVLLDAPDMGFAFLPDYMGKGLGYEAASATLRYAREQLGLSRILAITLPENEASVNLLLKIGMRFEKMVQLGEEEEELMLFSTHFSQDDQVLIDKLTHRFFTLFNTVAQSQPEHAPIHDLFINEGLIIKNSGFIPEVLTLEGFIDPREHLLSDGTLTDFTETELSSKTIIAGRVAQRLSFYRKMGKLAGSPFSTTGVKSFQFVYTPNGWKISVVAWDDDATAN